MRRVECGRDDVRDVVLRHVRVGVQATIGGEEVAVRVHHLGPGRFAMERDAARETFHCVREGDVLHLFFRGRAYRLRDLGEGRRPASRAAAGSLEAPMPGKIIAIPVEEGQRVEKGDVVLVIEAMKMENALRAPATGRVKQIATSVGELVAPGRVLVELET